MPLGILIASLLYIRNIYIFVIIYIYMYLICNYLSSPHRRNISVANLSVTAARLRKTLAYYEAAFNSVTQGTSLLLCSIPIPVSFFTTKYRNNSRSKHTSPIYDRRRGRKSFEQSRAVASCRINLSQYRNNQVFHLNSETNLPLHAFGKTSKNLNRYSNHNAEERQSKKNRVRQNRAPRNSFRDSSF